MPDQAAPPTPSASDEPFRRLAGVMAHEINNLMTVVRANIELASSLASSERQRAQLNRAAWAADLATRLTRQALALARSADAEVPFVDINQTIARMDSLHFQLEGRDAPSTLSMKLSSEPLFIRVDPERLELCLMNLVRNAVDAMPAGGIVTISSSATSISGLAEVAVADTGVGIPSEVIERVAEPFFTTKTPGHGTGLGMVVVQDFVIQAGGTMKIESSPGEGTTIRLFFPMTNRSESSPDPNLSPA